MFRNTLTLAALASLLASCILVAPGDLPGGILPTTRPGATATPTSAPTSTPTSTPTTAPSSGPTAGPTASPTASASALPSAPPEGPDLNLYLNMEVSPASYLFNGAAVTSKGLSVAPGKYGQAWHFDGQGSYLKLPVDINPSKYPKLTLTAWARYTATTAPGIRQVLSHDNGGYDRSLGIDTRGGSVGWSCFGGSAGVLGSGEAVVANQWVFLASVYDQQARTVSLYVNGVRKDANGQLGEGHPYLLLGANPSYGENFTGDIDEVRVYGRALTQSEIDSLRSWAPAG